ncbi:hypothetical protein [Enhygromyxa salina]|uniref:Uncharacterized protein n=1 Tax=Enhygromyxa salina TaxID=215803 RepID=A0A2S9YAC4_9BACT|nr:hypothetical protein [Enhygromyxa salina]PRQ02053.1 hypothetical protein ENSA7_56260 [Enhygromyxa salina]
MICRSSIRRFDGDAGSTLHAAAFTRGATGLRFVSWVTINKGTGLYVDKTQAPAVTIAWVPAEKISSETSSPTEIDAALADPDQVPLIIMPKLELPVAYMSDDGSPFPAVGIKGQAMVLAARVEGIVPGTHGQLTFGWAGDRC